MTERDRELVAKLCAIRAGLSIDPDKGYLMESRLAAVARREGFTSVTDFVRAVRDRDEERLIWALVEAMVPPDTIFFRDPAMFKVLGDDVLPQAARQRGGAPVRIWSAACGSGQEAYSLAMLVDDTPGVTAQILATDLNERQLMKAQSGLYTQFEVQRGLSARRLVTHFEKREEMFSLSAPLKQAVVWKRVNLLEDPAPLGQFDVVVCAHVLGAMTEDARARAITGLSAAVAAGGFLVLSPGETLPELSSAFIAVGGRPGVYTTRAAMPVSAAA